MSKDTKEAKHGTVILSCDCTSEFQDRWNKGKGMRVMNVCAAGARCTVCTKVRSIPNKLGRSGKD